MTKDKTQDLQTLIRTVDPNDRAACDELNARFWCFVNRRAYKGKSKKGHHFNLEMALSCRDPVIKFATYAESLDALKAVQDAELEGWEESMCFCSKRGYNFNIGDKYSDWLSTMNLAWMDALVAAIQWERENEDG